MTPFTVHEGLAVPLVRDNIDTDIIIPKQYLKSVHRTGFGPHLFDDWRYLPSEDDAARVPNPRFVLNEPRYAGASILVTGDNFGCGSSREHAVWAFSDAGFRAILAPGFADIFDQNSVQSGLLTVCLPRADIEAIARAVEEREGMRLTVDLPRQAVRTDAGDEYRFDIEEQRKHRLLEGLDDIGLTLEHADAIRNFEERRRAEAPWLFGRFPRQ